MMDSEEEDQKSRSQAKREFQELKELVRELIELPAWHLKRIPLTEGNRDEILEARGLNRSALQRQLRHIVGRIDGVEDISAIRSAVADPPPVHVEDEGPDEIEQQADELISGDKSLLGRFIDEHPEVDSQKLRRLLREARKERQRGLEGPRKADKRVVDFLRK